jgi:hypothetical protein
MVINNNRLEDTELAAAEMAAPVAKKEVKRAGKVVERAEKVATTKAAVPRHVSHVSAAAANHRARRAPSVLAHAEGSNTRLVPASTDNSPMEPDDNHLAAIAKTYAKGSAKRTDKLQLRQEFYRRRELAAQYEADKGKDCSKCVPKYASSCMVQTKNILT